jgi:hypothetical protein
MYNLNALSNITPKFKQLLLQIKTSPRVVSYKKMFILTTLQTPTNRKRN